MTSIYDTAKNNAKCRLSISSLCFSEFEIKALLMRRMIGRYCNNKNAIIKTLKARAKGTFCIRFLCNINKIVSPLCTNKFFV